MTNVTNKHTGGLGLPVSKITIPANATVNAERWSDDKNNEVVKHWVKVGLLVAEEGAEDADDAANEEAEKEAIREKLAEFGITKPENSKLETLQKALDKANEEATEKQEVVDQLNELGVEFDKEAKLKDLQKALDKATAPADGAK